MLGSVLNNRYTITARIGKGAMGTVYRATDAQTGQDVAVKVLSRDLALEHDMLERFRREGEALRQLRHPNIVGFVDMFEHDEQHVIVIEYVPGGNLHQLIRQGPLPVERARRIALELCDALTRAHHLQIIHRDLKPENVLLAADGTPKLSDFGVARLVSEANRITNTGTQVGTPFYMAPEAWEGSQLDAQADIWALGVVFFEMLTGQVPFGGDTLIAVMNKVLNAPLPDLCQLRAEVPPGLAQVVAGMLTRDKARRYSTMRVVAADLERGEPVAPASAAASLSATQAATPVATHVAQRRRAAWPVWAGVVGGFVVLAGLALGAVFMAWKFLPAQVAPTAPAASPVVTATAETASAATQTLLSLPSPASAATPPPVSTAMAETNPSGWQWQRVAGGHLFPSATINTLAVDPRDSEHVMAGTYGSGIYLSSDGGQTWTPANTGLGAGLVASLAIDPQDPNIIYVGMAYQGGVYKSTDGGQTWQSVNTGIDLNNAWNWTAVVAVDVTDPRRVYYTGAYGGLWLSTDAGASWTLQGPPKQDCVHIIGLAIDPADGQHLYAASNGGNGQPGCPSGIYDSGDGGHTWQRLSTDAMTNNPTAIWSLGVDPGDFKVLYTGADTGTWKSGDGGKTWIKVKPESCSYMALNPGDRAIYCMDQTNLAISRDGGQTWQNAPGVTLGSSFERRPLAFAPSDPKTMYTGYDKLLRSADNGASWQTRGNFGGRRAQLTVDPRDGNRLYLVSGERDQPGGLYLSTDGGQSWQPKLTDVMAGRLAIDGPANVVYYASVASKNGKPFYRSLDNGTTWTGFGSGDLGKIWQLLPTPLNSNRLWAMPECGSPPLLSEDNGQTFKELAGFSSAICMPIMAMSSKGERLYIATWGDFRRSVDNGQTWKQIAGPGGIINSVVVDPLDPNVVYLGTTHLGVRKTTDGGDTWQPAGLPSAAVNEIAVDPQNPQTLYAASDEGAFISLDGGAQWQPLARGLGPNPIVYSIAVDPNDPHRVFAATADGVFQLNIAAAGLAISSSALTPGGFSRVELNVAKGAECNPSSAPAGLVVFHYGVGGGSKDLATTLQVIGADTYGTIVANGQVVPPANTDQAGQAVDAHGRTLAPNKDEVGNFSFETYAAAPLQPGPYEMRATWNRADGNSDPRSCTLTVRP